MLSKIVKTDNLEDIKITPLDVTEIGTQTDLEISPDYLPLDFVKEYLRIDHDLDDMELRIAIKSAQTYVRKYTKTPDDEDLEFDLITPVLCLISHFYESKSPLKKATDNLDVVFGSMLEMNRQDIL